MDRETAMPRTTGGTGAGRLPHCPSRDIRVAFVYGGKQFDARPLALFPSVHGVADGVLRGLVSAARHGLLQKEPSIGGELDFHGFRISIRAGQRFGGGDAEPRGVIRPECAAAPVAENRAYSVPRHFEARDFDVSVMREAQAIRAVGGLKLPNRYQSLLLVAGDDRSIDLA